MAIPTDEEMSEFKEELEKLGTERVRDKLSQKIWNEDKTKMAEIFLKEKQKEKQEAFQRKQIDEQTKSNNLVLVGVVVTFFLGMIGYIFKYFQIE